MLKVSQILGRILHQSGLEVKVKIQDASNARLHSVARRVAQS